MECRRWKLRGDAQPPGERMGYEVSVSWSPESPLFAEVRVRQKQGDGWSPPGRRVPVSLNLRRNPSRTSLHSAYTAHVIDRASPAGPMSQLWFKDTHEFQPLRTDLQTGVCRINLLRSFDVESNTSYALSYDRLTDLFQLVNSAQGSRPLGRIEADLEAVVYSPDDPKRTTIIAQSERVRVSIDHIARIVEIRPPDPVATRVEVRRRGKLIKQYKRTEMGRFLRGEEQLKLIPGDLILLGPYDGVNVMWRTSQDEWKITADPGTLASVGADHAAVVVGPEGGPPSSGLVDFKGNRLGSRTARL